MRLLLILAIVGPPATAAVRLKDVAAIEGVRDNQLIGYGLVVGLNGTGDKRQTVFSTQTLTNMLGRMGVAVSPTAILVRNMAAVMVTATLPPFAQPGTHIDLTASAIGDAASLQGGMLLLTPLKGADGQVYAVAQGPVVTGGFVAGRPGNNQTVNHPTVGRVPEGAIVEKAAPTVPIAAKIRLQLRRADFTTATRIVEALNREFGAAGRPAARAESSALVVVETPSAFSSRPVEFLAAIESLSIDADRPARIVVNERTGTVVMGKEIGIAPTSILQGSLTVEIQTTQRVSQPEPLSSGKTVTTADPSVSAKEEKARNVTLQKGATVEDLVRALLAIGSTPRDIIAILQNLKAAGAIDAELQVI